MGFSRRFGTLARGLLVAVALPAGAVSAFAQQNSTCAQLEASLTSLDRGADSWASRQGQAAKLRGDLDRYSAQAKNMGCDAPRGFLIFQNPGRPPQCDQIDDQISRLRSSIAGLEKGGSSDQAGQRRALILALAQNNCGAQYTAAVRTTAAPAQPQRPRNFLESIFGAPVQSDPEETTTDVDLNAVAPASKSGGGGSRTVCVRMCDGYFFPLSRSSNSSRFATEDALCKKLCPNADTQLFTLSGEDIRNASSISGQSYMSTPNALRYRKELVSSCTCRAPGQSWAQALAGVEDETTLQKGDILVTEEQAREMSQPKPVDPAPGAKGKSASSAPNTATAGSPAANVAAPMAPASEQPGQRPVRVIPLPRSQNAPQQ
ncbi:DUF2865 domain-containing protein [Xanthobacter agilis]|uniref:DUF2865 domain-containing protein n=1 Tax=Xanthobacter agilis TaxID=47492 RepID=A0ABU0LH88_XANAG|nr:DUF2865 domain-containing protein [Xanthobacter agilis]MDQ0506489.1 hypothetical protein [Xanthobacter agilis]